MPDPLHPLLNMRFRVEVDGLAETGVVEVVFPEARLAERARNGRRARYGPLLLRRGLGRTSDWHAWWEDARRMRMPPARTITVTVRDVDGSPANRWIFSGAQPVGYSLSNLNALGHEALIETLELTVATFESTEGQRAEPQRRPSRERKKSGTKPI
jgi:phage tail-like protein